MRVSLSQALRPRLQRASAEQPPSSCRRVGLTSSRVPNNALSVLPSPLRWPFGRRLHAICSSVARIYHTYRGGLVHLRVPFKGGVETPWHHGSELWERCRKRGKRHERQTCLYGWLSSTNTIERQHPSRGSRDTVDINLIAKEPRPERRSEAGPIQAAQCRRRC